jgi:GNAT superfamily N-acetyltransferase
VVGTHDSTGFAARLEREWWPALRAHYATIPSAGLTPADIQRIEAIRHPAANPPDIVAGYPAHIHMNLLPRLRGRRVGSRLLAMWIDQARKAGIGGIHLGASAANTGAVAFWSKSGFKPLAANERVIWFGMTL